MRNKTILFICVEGFDTPGPSNHLINSLIEDLLKYGFNIHLIQSRRSKINNDIPLNLQKFDNFVVDNVDRKIIRKNAFIKRYIEEAIYSFKCFLKWRYIRDVDAVFVQSCPTVVFTIILLKLFKNMPILYSIQDMWPGSAANSGVLKNKLILSILTKLQKVAYRYSDVLTVISEDMKRKVIEQGVADKKIIPIVNWYDDQSVSEVDWGSNKFVKKYNLDENIFYVQYAGTMGYVFDYKMVLDVAERLNKYNDIEFHMIGQGSQKEEFIEEVKKRKLNNIRFFPLEPQHMVSDVYSACSVCLIPLKKGIIGNSVPSKAGLLMACNRPIINSVDYDSEYYRMFNEKKIGISVSNDDPSSVTKAILSLKRDINLRKLLAINAHNYGKIHFSRSNNTKLFCELFCNMINK